MPVKINIIEDGIGIEFILTGRITGNEIIEANNKIYTKECLRRLKYKLIDRSDCTDYNITPEELKFIANQDIHASQINSNVTVIIISKTELQYGMSRMWQVFSGETGFKSELFKDRESADIFINKSFLKPN